MSNDTPETQAARCDDASAVIGRARRALSAVAAEMPWTLSPIFPETWPPSGKPVAMVYAYVTTVLPTSMERLEVYSPFLRLQILLTDASAPPEVSRFTPRSLGSERGDPRKATPEVMEQAAGPLLDAICAGVLPTAADAPRLRAAYREWIFEHGVLADELRAAAPAFFTWIAEGE